MTNDKQACWAGIERAMAVFAHCDDVELRMGGTFARLAREGKRVTYVVCVENAYVGKHMTPRPLAREALAMRRAESTQAAGILGAARTEFLAFKSYYFSREDGTVVYPSFNSLEDTADELRDAVFYGLPPVLNAYTIPACRDRLLDLIREEQPQLIFTQAPDDRHQDHYAVARLATLLVEDLRREGMPIDLWYSEPGTGGAMAGFWPDTFVELAEEDVQRRLEANACFVSQYADGWQTYNRDRVRAYGRLAGVPYAEAFQTAIWPTMMTGDGAALARIAAGLPARTVIPVTAPPDMAERCRR